MKIKLGYQEQVGVYRGQEVFLPWFFGKAQVVRDEFSVERYQRLKKNGFDFEKAGVAVQSFDGLKTLGIHHTGENYEFEAEPYTRYIQNQESFWVPIEISFHHGSQQRARKLVLSQKLPEDLRNYILEGKAKVLIFSLFEGFIENGAFQDIEFFCRNHGFSGSQVWVITANQNLGEIPDLKQRSFRVKTVNYFGDDLWFEDSDKIANYSENLRKIQRFYRENASGAKPSRFLCLNRRWDAHRAFIIGFLRAYPSLIKTSLTSLGVGDYDRKGKLTTGQDALDTARVFELTEQWPMVESYYRSVFDRNILSSVDMPDDPWIVSNRVDLNEQLYRGADINLLTETHFFSNEIRFLSEKTFKSIKCLQPIIMVSSAGTLECLRKLGYKTFDRWWDESYDEIEEAQPRMDAICRLVLELGSKSREEMSEIVVDMNETLYRNAKLLLSNYGLEDLLDFLTLELQVNGNNLGLDRTPGTLIGNSSQDAGGKCIYV